MSKVIMAKGGFYGRSIESQGVSAWWKGNRTNTRIRPCCSLLRRGSKGFFSRGEDPLSNVSAGTVLPPDPDPFDFAPANTSHSGTSAEERVLVGKSP